MKTIIKPSLKRILYFFILVVIFWSCNEEELEPIYLTIQSVSTTEGILGSEVTIEGTGFSSDINANDVRFGGVLAKVKSATTTKIVTEVPVAPSGNLTVTVNNEEAVGPHFTIPLNIIGYTSFEEVPTFIGDVFYPKIATVNLVNTQLTNPSSTDPYVDFTRTGNELGFDLSYDPNDIGDNGIERIGIFSNANIETRPADFEARFEDGNQGFLMSDSDGTLVLTFDEITGLNSNTIIATIEIKVYVSSTTFETGEGFQVFYKTANGLGNPIFDYFGNKADGISGNWVSLTAAIPNSQFNRGNIVIKLKGTVNAEMVFIDYVAIKGI